MDAGSAGNSVGRKAAAKLMPKKFGVKNRWRKQHSNESFASLASTENEEYPRGRRPSTRESETEGSRPGSLSTTQSNELVGDYDDVETAEANDGDGGEVGDGNTTRGAEHES